MIIKVEDILKSHRSEDPKRGSANWLHSEILSSVSDEALMKGSAKGEYDVKLIIEGIEHEPTVLKSIIEKIEDHIDREAELLANRKLKEALAKVDRLGEIIDEVAYKIRDEFNINDPENESGD